MHSGAILDALASADIRTLPPVACAPSASGRAGFLRPSKIARASRHAQHTQKGALNVSLGGEVAAMRFDLPAERQLPRPNQFPSTRRLKLHTQAKAAPTRVNPEDWLRNGPADCGRVVSRCVVKDANNVRPSSSSKNRSDPANAGTLVTMSDETLAASVKRIQNYTKLLNQQSLHHFIIWKGKRVSSTPEFVSFRRRYAVRWSNINYIIGLLEDLCLKHTVPLALVDGSLVDALAKCDLHCLKIADLQACIHNIDNLQSLELPAESVDQTRERDEHIKSVTIIQAAVRRALAQKLVRYLLARTSATIKIQSTLRRHSAQRIVLGGLAKLRAARDVKWKELNSRLRANASSLASGKARVEIHLPSIGYTEHVRLQLPSFAAAQALQVARLCAAADPAVHVVYVSPVTLSDELVEYYRRIVALRRDNSKDQPEQHRHRESTKPDVSNIPSAPVVDSTDGASSLRASSFTIVVPELSAHFPGHTTLASRALYSPACSRRLRKIAAGNVAVIIPGGPVGWAERMLALELDVPLLAPDPAKAAVYSCRSGIKRVLCKADVNVPVGAHDIYDEEDFLVALAKLIARHLEVGRWIFAIDVDSAVSGIAYLDVDRLEVVRELRGESHKLTVLDRQKGESAWRLPDVQVLARTRVLRMLRSSLCDHVVVCARGKLGSDWKSFLRDLKHYGAVIEAEPRCVIGRLAVHTFVRPDGAINVIASQELLVSQEYERLAAIFPQLSVPGDALVGAASAVARQLFSEEVIGYFTIHFVAFQTQRERSPLCLWATELELGMNPFVVGHFLHKTISKPATITSKQHAGQDVEQTYFLVPQLNYDGLTAFKFSSYFKLCRLYGLSFNVHTGIGVLIILIDSLASGILGIIVEGTNRLEVLGSTLKFLMFLKKHVTSANILQDDGTKDATDLSHMTSVVTHQLQRDGMSSEHDRTLVKLVLDGRR